MRARVRKWGNSLALRLPRSITEEAGVAENDAVDIGVIDGRIVVVPRTRFRLDDLLRGITRSNRHAEAWTAAPRGREHW